MTEDRATAVKTTPDASEQQEGTDVYELLVAELEGRRERLRDLLQLVTREANRAARKQIPTPVRPRCRRTASHSA